MPKRKRQESSDSEDLWQPGRCSDVDSLDSGPTCSEGDDWQPSTLNEADSEDWSLLNVDSDIDSVAGGEMWGGAGDGRPRQPQPRQPRLAAASAAAAAAGGLPGALPITLMKQLTRGA